MRLPTPDPADAQIIETTRELLKQRSYDEAANLLLGRVAQGLATDTPTAIAFLGEVAGLLIDVGAEGHDEHAVTSGLALLENHDAALKGLMTLSSCEYNLGNAKIALVDLHARTAQAAPGLADHDLLLAAKNHYWRALKALDRDGTFAHQVRTNLANALRTSGRIAEALTVYDEVLAIDPTFGMAHFHRGLALVMLEKVSRYPTTQLLATQLHEYGSAADATDLPPAVRGVAATMHDRIAKRLERYGHTSKGIRQEGRATRGEAKTHSPYRQFALREHLALSEQALYCHCNGARRDNLMVATRNHPVTGNFIPRMELILNRLKAEFGSARLLYYQMTQERTWDLHEGALTFTELFEGEQVSMRTEFLRTSFRLCLGILDKIALGVCELYQVADEPEKLYFESFWQPPSRKGKASTRWATLASKSTNPALVALYSQATDLGVDGEWSLLKTWRNHLEHRFLLLTTEETPTDTWKAREGTFGAHCITEHQFTQQTLHLLQFTRSAIFNFVWCVRREAQTLHDGPSKTMTLQYKTPPNVTLLFQYGSNCDEQRLNSSGRLNGAASNSRLAETVDEYELAFDVWSIGNKSAASNLVLAPGAGRHAFGVLYEIPTDRMRGTRPDGKRTMEQIEGKYYEERPISVRLVGGEVREAVTFLVKTAKQQAGLWTSGAYVKHIVDGLRAHRAPLAYVEHVIAAAITTNQQATSSHEEETQLIARLR